MPSTLLNLGDEPQRGTADKCTRDQLYAHLSQLVSETLDSSHTAEELLSTTDLPDGEKAAKYELRHKAIAVSESGLVGRCSVLEMQSTIDALFQFDCIKALQTEQPDMQWVVVAGRINRIDLRKTTFKENPRSGFNDDTTQGGIYQGIAQLRTGNLVPPARTHYQIPEYKAILEVAFAGVGGSLLDQWSARTGFTDGPLQAYIRSKALRHLPASLRKQRKLATALIEAFYAQEQVTDPAAEPTARLTEEQLVAGRKARESGMSWGDIATMFGVSHQLARAAIEKAQKQVTGEV